MLNELEISKSDSISKGNYLKIIRSFDRDFRTEAAFKYIVAKIRIKLEIIIA